MDRFLVALLLSLTAAAAGAKCTVEDTPSIPDGKTASEAEMGAAQQAVKAFMASSNAYLACLDEEGKAAGSGEAKAMKIARNKAYNAAVDEMNSVAGKFNSAIKAYKSAH